MFNFEKLDVWKKAIAFAGMVYAASKRFPTDEQYGLISQIRRAAASVSSNLAEGTSRSSQTNFARFVEIAVGSLFEVVSQMYIGRAEGWLSESDFQRIYTAAEELSRMCSGLRAHLTGSKPNT